MSAYPDLFCRGLKTAPRAEVIGHTVRDGA